MRNPGPPECLRLTAALPALPFVILAVFIKYFLARDLPTIENVVPGAGMRIGRGRAAEIFSAGWSSPPGRTEKNSELSEEV